MKPFIVVPVALAILLASCAPTSDFGVDVARVPAALGGTNGDPADPAAQLLRVGDTIEVFVYGEPELSRKAQIGPSGTIVYPLLGQIELAGLTRQAAADRIRDLLAARFVKDPRVDILVGESLAPTEGAAHVTVMGEVSKSGRYPLPEVGDLTVLELIAQAGGFSNKAAPNKTRVLREVEGKKQTIEVRLGSVMSGDNRYRDLILCPGDVVIVPQSFF